jgi:hypothetical protein
MRLGQLAVVERKEAFQQHGDMSKGQRCNMKGSHKSTIMMNGDHPIKP